MSRVNSTALALSGAFVSALVTLGLGVLGRSNLPYYESAVGAALDVLTLFSLTNQGILAGAGEAALITGVVLFVLGGVYNFLSQRIPDVGLK